MVFGIIWVLLVWTGAPVLAEQALHVESFPKGVKQGEVCVIRATGPPSIRSAQGEFQGKTFSMRPVGRDGIVSGLLGIDMDTPLGRHEVKLSGVGGEGRTLPGFLLLEVERTEFTTQTLSLPPSMVDLDAKTLERVNQESRRVAALFQEFRDERLWRGAFVRPVQGEISSAFGVRRVINGKPRSPHTGVDIAAGEGTPVLATNDGVVVMNEDLFLSGKSVILDHGLGIFSMYFHLSEALLRPGERIFKGTVLGKVGSTGRSTKPHLHWGIRMNGARVDPLSLFRLTEQIPE